MNEQRDMFDSATQSSIDQATDHADRVIQSWSDKAYAQLVLYNDIHGYHRFCATDVRRWATQRGLSVPPHNRAWGGVFQRASRAKIIVRAGASFCEFEAENSHPTIVAFWVRNYENRS